MSTKEGAWRPGGLGIGSHFASLNTEFPGICKSRQVARLASEQRKREREREAGHRRTKSFSFCPGMFSSYTHKYIFLKSI